MNRKVLHAIIALILVVCIVCPYAETALGWDGDIFTTGRDSETTVAIIILLFELVLALASVLFLLLPKIQASENIATELVRLTCESVLRLARPEASPPIPLRI